MSGDEASGKRLTKRAQRTENTKRRILDASIKLFMDQGYEKTTTRQILNEVGILNGSLYNIYKSKEDIFADIIVNALNEAIRHATENLPDGTPARMRLAYIFHIQLYFAARSQRIAELLTIAHEKWRIHKKVVDSLTEWVREVDTDGEMYTDAYDFPMKLDACAAVTGCFIERMSREPGTVRDKDAMIIVSNVVHDLFCQSREETETVIDKLIESFESQEFAIFDIRI